MENVKITSRMAITYVLDNFKETLPTEYADKFNEMLKAMDKKNTKAAGKPSKNQQANAEIKARMFEILSASDTPMCISDIIVALNEPYTNQKISALLKQMIVANMVVRTEIKGKAFFKNC